MKHNNAVEAIFDKPISRNESKSTERTWIFRIKDLEFFRWKNSNILLSPENDEISSLETTCKVSNRAAFGRSTGARNASNEGDLRRRNDENIAADTIYCQRKNISTILSKLKGISNYT